MHWPSAPPYTTTHEFSGLMVHGPPPLPSLVFARVTTPHPSHKHLTKLSSYNIINKIWSSYTSYNRFQPVPTDRTTIPNRLVPVRLSVEHCGREGSTG